MFIIIKLYYQKYMINYIMNDIMSDIIASFTLELKNNKTKK